MPPQHVLRQFLVAPETLASELREQLVESINCQRALEHVQARVSAKSSGLSAKAKDFLENLSMPQGQSSGVKAGRAGGATAWPYASIPGRGEIWRCASKVEVGDRGQIHVRRTYQPMDVLILTQPSPTPWAEQVWQAVVCSPYELWPKPSPRAGDIVFQDQSGADWVAHASLAGPIIPDSLESRISVVPSNHLSAVAAAVLKKPAVSVHGLERARLAARASYAFATARARQAQRDLSGAILDCFKRHHKETEPIILLAAGTKSPSFTRIRTRVFIGPNPFESRQAGHGFCAAVLVPLHQVETPANGVRGVWKIEADDPVFRPGSQASLISRSNLLVVATGTVAADGLTIEFRSEFAGSDADLAAQDWFIWGP